MSIDLKQALKAPMQTDNWAVKVLIGGIVYLVPILSFAALGYWLDCLLAAACGKDKLPGGPTDNLSKNFITGLKMFAGYAILGVLLGIVTIVLSMVFAKLKVVGFLLSLIFQIAVMFGAMFLTLSFAMDKKILSMLDIQRTMKIMKGNPDTTNFVIQMLLLIIVFLVIVVVCCITVVGSVLVPFLSFAFGISMYNFMGQYLKSSPYFSQLVASKKQQSQQANQQPNQQ